MVAGRVVLQDELLMLLRRVNFGTSGAMRLQVIEAILERIFANTHMIITFSERRRAGRRISRRIAIVVSREMRLLLLLMRKGAILLIH